MSSKNIPVLNCPKCGKYYIPAKYNCPACGNSQLQEMKIDSKTTIFSFTTIRIPPEVYSDQAPYHIGLVRFEAVPDLMVTARVTGSAGVEIGIGKEVVFTGLDELGYRFSLVS